MAKFLLMINTVAGNLTDAAISGLHKKSPGIAGAKYISIVK